MLRVVERSLMVVGVAEKLASVVDKMPGKKGHMAFASMKVLNTKRLQAGRGLGPVRTQLCKVQTVLLRQLGQHLRLGKLDGHLRRGLQQLCCLHTQLLGCLLLR